MTENKNESGSRQNKRKSSKLLTFVRSSENFEKLADIKLKAGDYIGALIMLQRALEVPHDKNTVFFKIAEVLTEAGCYSDAMDFIAPLMDLKNDLNYEASRLLGFCYLGMYEFDAAADCFYRFLNFADVEDYSPEFLETVCDAADYCEQNRTEFDDDEDESEDERPVLRDSSEVEIENILSKASSLAKEQNTDGVKALLASGLEKYPSSLPLSVMMMFTCYCSYDFSTGISYYEKLPESEQKMLRPLTLASALYHGAHLDEKAQKCCELLLDMDFQIPEEYFGVCSMMIETGCYEYAVRFAQKGLSDYKYNKILIHNYAKASYELGKYEIADKQYGLLVKLNYNDPIAAYYKELCDKTLEDGCKRIINTDYALPSSQIIRRLRQIADLLDVNDKEMEEIRLKWNNGDKELISLINWAMLDKEPKFSNAFVHLIVRLGGERAADMLHRILIDPFFDISTKQIALGALKTMGKEGPFLAFYNGRMLEADIDINVSPKKKTPAALTKINSLLLSHVQDCGKNVKNRVKKLIYAFVLDYAENEYELSDDQRTAFAVVLEYYARRAQGKDDIDKHTLIEMRGITERRFINAEYKLMNVLKKALGEEIDD